MRLMRNTVSYVRWSTPAILLVVAPGLLGADSPNAPYPPSPVIRGITWHWDTYRTAAVGSDLWPVTWGPDGHLYTAWGDGGGFGGADPDGGGRHPRPLTGK